MSTLPEYLNLIAPNESATDEQQVAEKNVLALNSHMQTLYEDNILRFQRNLLAQHPVVLSLFTGQGGRSQLYLPGKQHPIEAPRVPILYELAKSCGHSSMGVYQVVAPALNDSSNRSWQGSMQVYRATHQAALDSLASLDLQGEHRDLLTSIIELNIRFMDQCLADSQFSLQKLEAFTHAFKPLAQKAIGVATQAQVNHWMGVFSGWKEELGKDWERTYAATNCLYVARQNNILFTVLVQLMGAEAMNDRLLLLETTSFETDPETMLDLLTRIIADRSLGQVFFKDYFLMDYELLGGGARKAIEQAVRAQGNEPILPPLVPFRSTDWPWKTDPSKGTGPSTLEEIE